MWFSIEVFDGSSSASLWAEAWGDALVEAAFLSGATNWDWHRNTWGVVLELEFADEDAFDQFRQLTSVTAALDSVPDPVSGLIVYRGRGGSAGKAQPRRPRPLAGSGAAALPLPEELFKLDDDDDIFLQSIDRRRLAFAESNLAPFVVRF